MNKLFGFWLLFVLLLGQGQRPASGQLPEIRFGRKVSSDVRLVYDRGLKYLAQSQAKNGSWTGSAARSRSGTTGITGLCMMAFLASGEDPNFGKYSKNVHKAVRNMILAQDPSTGYLPGTMYNHGFAMLALAEAYGAVDEDSIWDGSEDRSRRRSIGKALDLAVRCAVTAQKNNQWGGWRYSPRDRTADTSVSGAVLMGLLGARNAGIEVPDETIEKALAYFQNSTTEQGMVAYSGGIGGGFGASMNRSSIATLVYSVGKKKDWKALKATREYIAKQLEHQEGSYPYYFRYYMAQALFQSDFKSWEKWNRETVRFLKNAQQKDGSFPSSRGMPYGTAMSLLAMALNYRFLPIYER